MSRKYAQNELYMVFNTEVKQFDDLETLTKYPSNNYRVIQGKTQLDLKMS